ncbi:MAG: sigma-70 family RNA polymerase sigma factor [Oscillospiraceae bacterium]|nr:sigma-70 family RNA polymerase sigma factor [Oscillospiraceae bacterium]
MDYQELIAKVGISLAPMEIESVDDMEFMPIDQGIVSRILVGKRWVKVLLVEAEPEVCRLMLADLKKKYNSFYRQHRCLVPGVRKDWIRCPETNHCDACPYGREPEQYDPGLLSLEGMFEDEEDVLDPEFSVERITEWREMFAALEEVSPEAVRAIKLKIAGFNLQEIADRMGKSVAAVNRLIVKARAYIEGYLT